MRNVRIFAHGKMAEWSNAAVLKTVDLHGSGGSNPSLSAKTLRRFVKQKVARFFYLSRHKNGTLSCAEKS